MFFAWSLLYGCPHACLCSLACPRTLWGWVPEPVLELIAVVSELLSELLSELFSEQIHPPPNSHCLHIWMRFPRRKPYGCQSFQKIFQIHIIISINIVMSSSKDWSFNQILANFWSFLSISAFVSIIFYNFAIKQQ